MESDSREITIGDVAKIKHGFAFKGAFFTKEKQPNVLVTPGNFAIGGGFQVGKPKYYHGPVPDEYVLSEGDLVVTMTDLSKGTDTLGYTAKVPSVQGVSYLHNQRIGLVQMKSESIVRREWLHYLMRTEAYRVWVIGSASGTTVKHTSPSRIESFAFTPPPVEQQDEAVKLLNALEERVSLLLRTNARLEAIAQALFKSWFVDFDPVRAKAEGREPEGMDAATAALFPNEFDASELGRIPHGWKVEEIGNLVECLGGGTPSTRHLEFWEGGEHHWATPKDLSGLQAPVLLSTGRKITDAGVARISSGMLPAGTLLMSSRAPIGYLAIAAIPTAINQGFIAIPPGGALPPAYLLFWAEAHMDLIKQKANGSTFMEISRRAFRPIKVMVPPLGVLAAFASTANPILDRIKENERHAANLSEIRDALLPRLISGKLRLPDAEREIEAATA